MRRWIVALAACALLAAPAAAGERHKALTRSFSIETGQALQLELPVGELVVLGSATAKIEAELRVTCRWGSNEDCERLLEQVELDSRDTPSRKVIEVVSDSSWRKTKLEIKGEFRVPKGVDLEVDMGVGELEIEGFENDLSVDLGVGELRIRMAAAKVGSVALDAGVGEAELRGAGTRVEGRRSMVVGSEVYWDQGEGQARIRADVGVGEIRVTLH